MPIGNIDFRACTVIVVFPFPQYGTPMPSCRGICTISFPRRWSVHKSQVPRLEPQLLPIQLNLIAEINRLLPYILRQWFLPYLFNASRNFGGTLCTPFWNFFCKFFVPSQPKAHFHFDVTNIVVLHNMAWPACLKPLNAHKAICKCLWYGYWKTASTFLYPPMTFLKVFFYWKYPYSFTPYIVPPRDFVLQPSHYKNYFCRLWVLKFNFKATKSRLALLITPYDATFKLIGGPPKYYP